MSVFTIGRAHPHRREKEILEQIFRLRHKVFYEKLEWQVNSDNGMERDLYDELKPVYLASTNNKEELLGTMRILPTTGPYMLKNTFPVLLRGEPAPVSEHIWETSRFAVFAAGDNERVQARLNLATFQLWRQLYTTGVEMGITHFVGVTSVAVERLLKRLGLPLERFGDGKPQRIGHVLSVACWLEVNEQFRKAVNGRLPANQVEERELA